MLTAPADTSNNRDPVGIGCLVWSEVVASASVVVRPRQSVEAAASLQFVVVDNPVVA